jgi:hypothetical protein
MKPMEIIINSLPPDMIRIAGQKVIITFVDGNTEECYLLGRHQGTVVVSLEPYVALKPFRDIHLVSENQVAEIIELD